MKYIRLIFLLILLVPITFFAQEIRESSMILTVNQYGLPVVSSIDEYMALCRSDSTMLLIDLPSFIPGIVLDIRYATTNNFTGSVLYSSPKAFLRLPAAKALAAVQAELAALGFGLKVYDAYRPYSVTERFWDLIHDDRYVADPAKGSRHNRGAAVDVTLIYLATGDLLAMPTPYDDFSETAHHDFLDLPNDVLQNRALLKSVMEKYGFTPFPTEWWHYDFAGYERFPLMDIAFEEITSVNPAESSTIPPR